ncbi:hypothetical protein FMM05_10065 [Flavobacterium zepuense]|uniref:LTXXQ motif family protein n=1 Tax=Flavobacterium zepuense TaxID=2593302 RepID=A0A552V300_9FLAO|nr:hypothetical protein [Flavobacterium zepuense]TRW24835.1 hypothetical protein FMM05_10065 [Flavobacterium zepuense]
MKSKVFYIALFAALLFTGVTAFAQMDRSVGQSQYKNAKGKKGKPADFVQLTVDYYTKELKLDDFQIAAVREIMEDQRSAITQLGEAKDITDSERKDKANAINDRIETRIKPLLSEDQKKKYDELQEKRKKS